MPRLAVVRAGSFLVHAFWCPLSRQVKKVTVFGYTESHAVRAHRDKKKIIVNF